MDIIEVSNLSFSYEENLPTINNLNFKIKKGSYTCILGHNGCGKSTLAKLLAGLLSKKEGEIIIDKIPLNEGNLDKIRAKMGIVFQNPDNQFIGSSVRDDIAFGLENQLVASEKMDEIINDFAAKVGLSNYLDKEPMSLSGGQKQRCAIAGILAMKPEIIIFDEATSMLDPKGREDIKKIINDLHLNDNKTIISITHDLEEAIFADELIIMHEGKIVMQGAPLQVLKDKAKLRELRLDMPFIMKVMDTLKAHNININANSIEGIVLELCKLK